MAFRDDFKKGQVVPRLKCFKCNSLEITWFEIIKKHYKYICLGCGRTMTEDEMTLNVFLKESLIRGGCVNFGGHCKGNIELNGVDERGRIKFNCRKCFRVIADDIIDHRGITCKDWAELNITQPRLNLALTNLL